MQLSMHESRLVLTALQTLDCKLVGEIDLLANCSNLLIHPAYAAFDHQRRVSRLTAELAAGDACELAVGDWEIAARGLSRYADLLAESAERDDVQNDDFASPEQSRRERQLKETARLLARIAGSRPSSRRLQAVPIRSAM